MTIISEALMFSRARAAEITEYYPFGGIRLNQQATSFGEQRRFAEHEYDSGTGRAYMDARYQNGSRANFPLRSPSFLDLGSPNLANGVQQGTLLVNPAAVGLSGCRRLPEP
jgi:hypothetical protein